MKSYERLLNYVKINTQSADDLDVIPSTACQFEFAKVLEKEMKELGLMDVYVDEFCNVYGKIPATAGMEDVPALGFLAHLDTAPDFSGEQVNPQVIADYDGGDVVLGESKRVLLVKAFPHLKKLAGRTLITTDGTTLLGADDKAGIAEILTACERLIESKEPHGMVCVAFTPDEEVGTGACKLDLKRFGAVYAYTMDGGAENELEYENFNASDAVITFHGVNVHPGDAKDVMVNAAKLAMEFQGMLPSDLAPERTEGYEGFFHLLDMNGTVEQARLHYIVRDHDMEKFREKEALLASITGKMNEKYGEKTVELTIKESYRNMKEKIEPCMFLIENVKTAMKAVGMEPEIIPIRGGTDGAALSFRGLPCPNLGTGGYCYHGPFEHITAEGMEMATSVVEKLMKNGGRHKWE